MPPASGREAHDALERRKNVVWCHVSLTFGPAERICVPWWLDPTKAAESGDHMSAVDGQRELVAGPRDPDNSSCFPGQSI